MILQYNELAQDLERVRRFLRSGLDAGQSSDQRRFAYIACVSAIYSSFENFAERVAHRFSVLMLANPDHLSADQMNNLRRRYVSNAATLLGQSLGVGRYREVTELDVARSLASCLDQSTSVYDLRLELIGMHSSNLRWDTLAELYRWAVPDLSRKIQSSDAVDRWMSLSEDVSASTLDAVLRSELDDLVERRNEVAHRAIPDEILSYERLIAKANFIEAVSLGLVASLGGALLEASIRVGDGVSLGTPSEYYQKNRVVVIPSIEAPISVGSKVMALGAVSTRWGIVLDIHVDDEPVGEADIGTEVGLKLDFQSPNGASLHILPHQGSDFDTSPPGLFGDRGPVEVGTEPADGIASGRVGPPEND